MPSYFQDSNFQNKLVAHIAYDQLFLKSVGRDLEGDDFKPIDKASREQWSRWVVGSLALDYFKKYKIPVKGLLKSELLSYIEKNRVGEKQKASLLEYLALVKKQTLEAGTSLSDKVLEFKKQRARNQALEKIIELQNAGNLEDEQMLQICRDVVDSFSKTKLQAIDFLSEEEFESRIDRRAAGRMNKIPLLFIDPLDRLVRAIGRKEVGLLLAPYKRGKSLALIHIALAYCVQALNVLFITAEDPKNVVEDRFDAAMTQLPIRSLPDNRDTLRIRFRRMRRMLRGRIHIVDATEGQCSLHWIEQLLDELRERGTLIDAIVIDYDDEINPPQKYKERRQEFAAIYRGLRRMAAKWDALVWTAAQTQRNTEPKKIIRGDDAAEDISKLRKVTMCISIGNGTQEHEKGFYLFVAAHKNDRKHIGTYIVHDIERSLFYDRAKTSRLLKKIRARRNP